MTIRASSVPLTKEAVAEYLDACIRHWRRAREKGVERALYYVDAYQSVRTSLLGELLPAEDSDEQAEK